MGENRNISRVTLRDTVIVFKVFWDVRAIFVEHLLLIPKRTNEN